VVPKPVLVAVLPDHVLGPHGQRVEIGYQDDPRAGNGLAASLRAFDENGRRFDVELADGIVVPLEDVRLMLPRP